MVPLAPFIQAELGISRAQIGLLISALYIGASLCAIPSAALTARLGVRANLVVVQVLAAGPMLLFALAGSFPLLLFAAALAGPAYGAINPPTSTAVVTWFSSRFRGTAMGIKQTGFALGNALGAALLPALATVIGWRSTLALACLGLFGSAGLAARLYRESPRGATAAVKAIPVRAALTEIFRNRNLMLLYCTGLTLAASQLVVTVYLLLFLRDAVGLPVVVAGQALALTQLSGAVARVGWGALSDRRPGGARRNVMILVGLLSALTMLLTSTLSSASPDWLVPVVAAMLGATAIGWNGVYFVLVAELAGPRAVASATGVSISIVFTGVIVGPPTFGWFVDQTESYTLAWRILAALNAANAALMLLIDERSVKRSVG
jgi:predicted MFS family arabinose efflux permease